MCVQVINRNFPWCGAFDDESFTGQLNETRVWCDKAYFELDNALYELSKQYKGADQLPRELIWRVMRIFSYALMTVASHYNPHDGYRLKSMDEDTIHAKIERMQEVFEGFFKGEMPSEQRFEYQPPHL